MARIGIASRLYRGEVSYDFVGRRRRWYALSGLVLVISLASLLFKGVHLGIDFKGGAEFRLPSHGHSTGDAQEAATSAGVTQVAAAKIGQGNLRVQTEALSNEQTNKVQAALAQRFGVAVNDVAVTNVGPTWGNEITNKAVQGLVGFLVAVVAYLSFRFEPKMAAAAIIALIHDLIITAGIYSLVGFEVTPSTVIALLTILGYSLYDTVVVFDKVRENTQGLAGGSRMTFSQAANLAVNQTLVRSINTSVIALLPVAALLFIGAGLLGAGTLKDLSLALFIGLASGAYSSIFTATPLVCDFKERESQFKALARRVQARQSGLAPRGAGSVAVATATAGAPAGTATAVLERPEPSSPAASPLASSPARPSGARPSRPQQPRRRGGRSGRPSGSKRRR
ncbi:MAG: protein translocase subunit SecF [Mycobacteriales bacterium]